MSLDQHDALAAHDELPERAIDLDQSRMWRDEVDYHIKPISLWLVARLRPFVLCQFYVANPRTPLDLDAFLTVNQVL